MDRSFQSPNLTRSPFSPKPRQGLSSLKRQSSVLPGFKKSSRYSVSGKSTQSVQIIAKTPYHTVETFGAPLPVLITEALTFADRNTIVTAHISSCGYAWVVCGRRLLIWQYRTQSRSLSTQCYELTLPQSDLVHRADLVCVIPPECGNQTPACLAVSPEGVVRYWPSILHEGVSVEQTIELHGQECDTVIHVPPLGCVLATTTCTVVLLQPSAHAGRHTVTSRMLKPPAGWLGGIGRRISSFIFGPMSTQQTTETKLVKMCTSLEYGEWNVYVLAGHLLQRWSLATSDLSVSSGDVSSPSSTGEQLTYECDVGRMMREAFHAALWDAVAGPISTNPNSDVRDADVWLLDMEIRGSELVLLGAAVNTQRSPQLHYALASVTVDDISPPTGLKSFTLLKVNALYREDAESEVLGYRLLLCNQSAYIYEQRSVIAIISQLPDEPDTIEFVHGGDKILGGSVCVNAPLFFTRNHGLVTLIANDFGQENLNSSVVVSDGAATPTTGEMSITEPQSLGNLTLYDLDPNEITKIQNDSIGHLKAAFIYYIKKNDALCEKVINEAFPLEGTCLGETDAPLDLVISIVSQDLVNDIPAGDPRWSGQSTRASLGSSSSMQILHQLQDKQRAHDLFLNFLKDIKLWDRLSTITANGTILPTTYLLAENAEKIIAAITLKTQPSEYKELIEQTLAEIIDEEEVIERNCLTNQDLFYRNITQIQRLIQRLIVKCRDQSHADMTPPQLATLISQCNAIILNIIQDVIQYRQQRAEYFVPGPGIGKCVPEYLPWTAALGTHGLRELLSVQVELTLKQGARIITGNIQLTEKLFEQYVNIVDIILDGRKCHLESIRGTSKFEVLFQQYEGDRHKFIKMLLDDKQYERGAILAEKYCDFTSLVIICEETNNQRRLDDYMERFATHNFSEFVFGWYLRNHKHGKLINRYKPQQKQAESLTGQKRSTIKKQDKVFAHFLGDYPTISWIQKVFTSEYKQASDTLYALAKNEVEFVSRKKTMLSLSKLAQLASQDTNTERIEDINKELTLIAHQEDLPDVVLSEYGYDPNNSRALSPSELIQLYISPENDTATEFDFIKALDLLPSVKDELERGELTYKIWTNAVLRDQWDKYDMNSPVESVMDTVFFKTIDLALFLGGEVDKVMPSLDRMLEAPELGDLKNDSTYQYLIKTGYEHIYRTHKST